MSTSPKKQTLVIIFTTLLAGFSSVAILNFTDPDKASIITFLFLYASLFLSSLGIFTLIGLILRQWFWPSLYVINLSNSFRQAFLLAILLTTSFWLESKDLFYWWLELGLVLFLAAVEAFLNLKI